MKRLILLAPILLFTALPAFADGMIKAQFGYIMQDDKPSGGSDSKVTQQFIDAAGGYLWSNRFTVFGQYSMETDTTTGSANTTRSEWGPGVGWISKADVGAYIFATYFFSATENDPGDTKTGWGYQGDLGLKVAISSVNITAGLAYQHFEYNKDSNGTLSPATQHTELSPRIGFEFEF